MGPARELLPFHFTATHLSLSAALASNEFRRLWDEFLLLGGDSLDELMALKLGFRREWFTFTQTDLLITQPPLDLRARKMGL